MSRARFAPKVHQYAAQIGVLDAERAVDIPGIDNPALAPTRFIKRQAGFELGIIERLHFPGDDSVLDINHPRAPAGAIHAMRAAHDLVVLPAVPVELLPEARLGIYDVFDPAHVSDSPRVRAFSSSLFLTDCRRSRQRNRVITSKTQNPRKPASATTAVFERG